MKLVHVPILLAIAGAAIPAAAQTPQAPQIPQQPSGPQNPAELPRDIDASKEALDRADDQSRRGSRAAARKASEAPRPAKPEELVVGAQVFDKAGVAIGAIDAVQADGIVVKTASGKVMVPAEAFGKNKQGLLINVTKQEFDALVLSASGQPAG